MNKPYFVRGAWDAEVWIATSDDVPGLVTEAATIEALDTKLKIVEPELLEAKGCVPSDGHVAVELLARRFSVAPPATPWTARRASSRALKRMARARRQRPI